LRDARVVAIYVAMHTVTRIAVEAIPRVRAIAPQAHLCVYGLYAPMNEKLLRDLGVQTVLGGEVEPALVSLVERLRAGDSEVQTEPVINLSKMEFLTPNRRPLPPLARYADLQLPEGGRKTVGFAEGTRGCKHLCRHCPVVPVYHGIFRVVPVDTVMADVRQQVMASAQHISFDDPDFLNGLTHALKLARAMHAEFPDITYDATIKIQRIIDYAELLPELKTTGCLFITTAVESIDDHVLELLAKNHTNDDFARAVALSRAAGIALAPTFVAFTPWTTREDYIALLKRLLDLDLVKSVPPIQLAIRLLIPQGSLLLELPGFKEHIGEFDPRLLGYPWRNPDARVDRLQLTVQELVAHAEAEGLNRRDIFARVWTLGARGAGRGTTGAGRKRYGRSDPAPIRALVLLRRTDPPAIAKLLKSGLLQIKWVSQTGNAFERVHQLGDLRHRVVHRYPRVGVPENGGDCFLPNVGLPQSQPNSVPKIVNVKEQPSQIELAAASAGAPRKARWRFTRDEGGTRPLRSRADVRRSPDVATDHASSLVCRPICFRRRASDSNSSKSGSSALRAETIPMGSPFSITGT